MFLLKKRAENGTRTRDPNLGKVVLYQLSYFRKNWKTQYLQVKRRRLELPRRNWHYPLKVARLPIPPPLQQVNILKQNGAQNRTRTCTPRGTRTWNVRVYQFRHLGNFRKVSPKKRLHVVSECWAENGTRTRDPNLGKVVLYQLSYFRLMLRNLCQ